MKHSMCDDSGGGDGDGSGASHDTVYLRDVLTLASRSSSFFADDLLPPHNYYAVLLIMFKFL